MFGKPEVDTAALSSQAVAYMQNRYAVPFSITQINGGGWDGSNMTHTQIQMTSPSLNDPQAQVSVSAVANGTTFTFSDDTYLYYKFAGVANQQALPAIQSIVGSAVIIHTEIPRYATAFPDSFNGQTTADQFFTFLKNNPMSNADTSAPIVSIRIVTIDTGQDLSSMVTSLIPALTAATGWGAVGRYAVLGSLQLQAYPADQYQAWANFYDTPPQLKTESTPPWTTTNQTSTTF